MTEFFFINIVASCTTRFWSKLSTDAIIVRKKARCPTKKCKIRHLNVAVETVKKADTKLSILIKKVPNYPPSWKNCLVLRLNSVPGLSVSVSEHIWFWNFISAGKTFCMVCFFVVFGKNSSNTGWTSLEKSKPLFRVFFKILWLQSLFSHSWFSAFRKSFTVDHFDDFC